MVLGEHAAGRPALHDPAAVEQHELVGVEAREGEVVHGRHDGQVALDAEGLDELEDLLLVADVEGARRLVEQQDRGVLEQRPAEHDALALAARQRLDEAAGQGRDPELGEDLARERDVAGALAPEERAVRRAAEQRVVEDCHPGWDHRHLGHERDGPGPGPGAQTLHVGAGKLDVPVPAGDEPGDGVQERRLAGAVRPDDGHPRAGRDGEVDPVQQPGAAQLDAHAVDGEPGRHRRPIVVRSTTTKNGAPTKAVTTPIGISAGAVTVRAARSASARNARRRRGSTAAG